MTAEKELLLVERTDDRLHITINRPEKRNALSLELLEKIGTTFAEHAPDESLKCAVLTGAGERSFAAGGDLRELDALRSEADATAGVGVAQAAGGGAPAADGNLLRLQSSNGAALLPVLLRDLGAAGIDPIGVEVAKPTLDDVFLSLTGRSLRD